ncbi:MAG: hypothetical protein WKF83_09960 [Nocardioidaceae bacterium]
MRGSKARIAAEPVLREHDRVLEVVGERQLAHDRGRRPAYVPPLRPHSTVCRARARCSKCAIWGLLRARDRAR